MAPIELENLDNVSDDRFLEILASYEAPTSSHEIGPDVESNSEPNERPKRIPNARLDAMPVEIIVVILEWLEVIVANLVEAIEQRESVNWPRNIGTVHWAPTLGWTTAQILRRWRVNFSSTCPSFRQMLARTCFESLKIRCSYQEVEMTDALKTLDSPTIHSCLKYPGSP